MIHPTAIIAPGARLDPTVEVGPYAVIDASVTLGPGCVIGPYAYLTGVTTFGAQNRVHAHCVIGGIPQDLKYRGEPTRLRIGERNVFREHVTVNCANTPATETVIGSDNLIMAGAHVAHDCTLGNYVILANGALLGGHVTLADRAFVSGNGLVHQFVRVGTLAFMQGGAAISKDLPPFTMARGDNTICGLNTVGLRRAGFSPAQRLQLKRLYHLLFRRAGKLTAAIEAARAEFKDDLSRILLDFVGSSTRGVCSDTGRYLPEPDDEEQSANG